MIPQYPNANAVESELKNANELDMMTGLLNFVKRRYTIVPIPAPKIAAGICVGRPIIVGTAIVAAMIARCKHNHFAKRRSVVDVINELIC